jgi:hypothetical protein
MRSFPRAAGAALGLAVLWSWSCPPLAAQGVTTAAVRGRVLDDAGAPVVGATVLLTNASTGQRFQAASRAGGLYNFENVAVGGPYGIEARAIGYQPARRTGITLALGQVLDLELRMTRAAVELEAIAVTAAEADELFAPDRQGTEFTIGDTAIARLPTLNRDFADFVQFTPQVGIRDGDDGGIVVAGQNNRYNTIQVDGSTVNDRFGLGRTGQTGGQANGRAVGLEAVKEYQVLLAPYDVRQGNFSGALINAVTKSGTNTFDGSAFYYFRNEGLAREPLGLTDFSQHQFGASIGGPIARDKAHFFATAEMRRRQVPASGPYIGQSAAEDALLGSVPATQADIDAVNAALEGYGLPTGAGGLTTNDNPLNNLLARLDFQLGDRSRLVFRYAYNTANDDNFRRFTSGNFDLDTYRYTFRSKTHNPALQFFTNFAGGASNELLLSWNRVRDRRTPAVTAPQIIVQNFASANGTGNYNIRSGAEEFSQGNELDQDIFELTDNFTLPVGDHRITIGTRNELYKVRSLFAQFSYGVWDFDNIDSLTNGVPERLQTSGDLGGGIDAKFTAGILGLYAQDQWELSPTFSLTYGLRVDVPLFFTQATYDSAIVADSIVSSTSCTTTDAGRGICDVDLPSGDLLWAPRLGFNWDLDGRGVTQVRGGAGIFTGAPAYVWYSNMYSNNGTKLGRLTCTGTNVPDFDPTLPAPLACRDGTGITDGTTLGEINTIQPDAKFPQVVRANLAIDRRLPGGIIGTFEGIYTKGINDYVVVNRNLRDDLATVDPLTGRVMYGTISSSGQSSPRYFNVARYGPSFNGGIYELRNTSNNYSWSLTALLQKRFSTSWSGTAGYTYSRAFDVASFTSSRATSNWRYGRVNAGDQNVDDAERSSFDRPSRVVITTTYTAPWKRFPTDISLSYVGQSGQPYTLIATGSSGRGDLNADGQNGNDPIYIPLDATDPAEMTFVDITRADGSVVTAAEQSAAFDQYIAEEPCLDEQRGTIMRRNTCRSPWQSFLNLTVRQSLPRIGANTLTLEIGVFNLLNLLDPSWGKVKTVDGDVFSNPAILTVPNATGGRANYQFDVTRVDERFRASSAAYNSGQVQIAVRYTF